MKFLPILHHNGNSDFYITLKYISTISTEICVLGINSEIEEKIYELKLNLIMDIDKYEYFMLLYSGDNISNGSDFQKELKIMESRIPDFDMLYMWCTMGNGQFFKKPLIYKKNTELLVNSHDKKINTFSYDFTLFIQRTTLDTELIYLATKDTEYSKFLTEYYVYLCNNTNITETKLENPEYQALSLYTRKQYLESFELCKKIDPLIALAKYYFFEKKDTICAYMFSRMSIEIEDANSFFFCSRNLYSYDRYILFADITFDCNKFDEGKLILQKIENYKDDEYTKNVLEKYQKIQNSVKHKTKKQFFNTKLQEYSQLFPNLNNKQLLTKVKNEWRRTHTKI